MSWRTPPEFSMACDPMPIILKVGKFSHGQRVDYIAGVGRCPHPEMVGDLPGAVDYVLRGVVEGQGYKVLDDGTVKPYWPGPVNDGGCHCKQTEAAPDPSAIDRVPDPWAHRSVGMRCTTCMFFVPKDPDKQVVGTVLKGRCRRHAPTMNGYPVVFANDWCGDHKLA